MLELFGDKLYWLRVQRAMTQKELAQQLGVATQSHISYLEGRRSAPSLTLVVRAADFFGVTTDYLLNDTNPVDQPTAYPGTPLPTRTLAQHFGAKLRQLRKQHGMPQVDLARRLGELSQGAVSAFERGDKIPSITIVLKCADLFGVTIDELLRD